VTESAPRCIFLDLFGTVVFFEADRFPRREVAGREIIMTIEDIDEVLAELDSGVSLEDFVAGIQDVSAQIAKEKSVDHVEVPSVERFRRTLMVLGIRDGDGMLSERLVNSHMNCLAQSVTCPPDRRSILAELSRRFPLALVSNFDHAATARAILDREQLTPYFDEIVISEEVGVCKPHPDIFLHAARALSVEPADCLHVGDSEQADIDGALGAGLRALQVGENIRAAKHPVLGDIAELNRWLCETHS
jgi:putative hydrolase of the HAD superfamily